MPASRVRWWVPLLLIAINMAAQSEAVSPSPRLRGTTEDRRLFDINSVDGGDQYVVIWENSTAFKAAFGSFLIVVVLFRCLLFLLVYRFRNSPSLQLAQPLVLNLYILSGAWAIGSCYLLLPTNNLHCLLREPFIFYPLTLCGCVLAGRAWRISILMTPVLALNEPGYYARVKRSILRGLNWMARVDFAYWCRPEKDRNKGRQSTLRQKVTLQRILWLIFLMSIPQLLIQAFNLMIPNLREKQSVAEVDSSVHLGRTTCRAPGGSWNTWIGVVLLVVPYLITGILSFHSGDLPKVFNEAEAVVRSFRVVVVVTAVAGPAYAVVDNPDGRTYLQACMLMSIAMAPVWFIVYPKLLGVSSGKDNKEKIGKMLLKRRSSIAGNSGSVGFHVNGGSKTELDHEKSAKLALTIGKMYEEMGLVQKSITLFDEALAVWQVDPARNTKEQIGGFTMDEISSFSPLDLEYIIQLLIAKGRVNGTFNSAVDTGQKNAAQSWLDALEIYERSPASIDMRDRSIIFPIFSGLFVFLKGGKIQQDKDCNFEQNLVRKFVRETKLHADPVHYTRALAMQCEVKARLGKYRGALETFEVLQTTYDPDEHSEGVSSAYGTDRSAQAYSQCALWYMMLGDMDKALEQCDYVVRFLLPVMDPKNVLNMCELLLPVIRIQKPRGEAQEMLKLFQEYVVENFNKHFGKDGVTPCLPIFKPLTLLLGMCDEPEKFPGFADVVEWLIEDENGRPPDFLDSVYTKLCWSPNTMVAELCMIVARRLQNENGSIEDCRMIVAKGLDLSKKAQKKMTDAEGTVILPIAFEIHCPVMTELEGMAVDLGIEYDYGDATSGADNSSTPNIQNLPNSYVRSTGSSNGSLTRSSGDLQPSSKINYVSVNSSDSGSGAGLLPLRDSSDVPVPQEAAVPMSRRSQLISEISIPPVEEEGDTIDEELIHSGDGSYDEEKGNPSTEEVVPDIEEEGGINPSDDVLVPNTEKEQ